MPFEEFVWLTPAEKLELAQLSTKTRRSMTDKERERYAVLMKSPEIKFITPEGQKVEPQIVIREDIGLKLVEGILVSFYPPGGSGFGGAHVHPALVIRVFPSNIARIIVIPGGDSRSITENSVPKRTHENPFGCWDFTELDYQRAEMLANLNKRVVELETNVRALMTPAEPPPPPPPERHAQRRAS